MSPLPRFRSLMSRMSMRILDTHAVIVHLEKAQWIEDRVAAGLDWDEREWERIKDQRVPPAIPKKKRRRTNTT